VVAGGRKSADAALIAALAGGATVRDAAAAAGVGEMTVYRRLKERDFRRQLDETRAEILTGAMARLSAAATDAVTTLTSLLAAESESVRLGAARSILDAVLRWREQAELAERLDRVEGWLDLMDEDEGGNDGATRGRWRLRA
jgi:AcrR family transcriptional regulator